MQLARSALRTIAFAVVAAFAVGACTPTATQPERIPGDRQLAQADKLSREGNPEAAAQAYEALAIGAAGELRDRLWLRAAREYVRANQIDKATALLNQISASLPTIDQSLRAQVAAEIALRSQKPDRALAELDRIPQPIPRESLADVLSIRSRALFALNRPAAGIMAALDREQVLSSQDEKRANQRMIWEGLQRSAANNADFTVPAGASRTVAGWLDLARAALIAARNPFTAKQDLADWRSRYPNHPAQDLLTQTLLPELGVGLEFPSHVALVLPLSGRMQAAGMAVRDGFLAALLQQDPSRRPVLNVYDSDQEGAVTAYQRAVNEGAEFIVGPLLKEEVTAVAVSGAVTVPTLALNQLSDEISKPAFLYQYSLDPEEEARQVAQRIANDGHIRGLVLLPNNEWGQRVFRAFDDELKTLGGSIAAMRFYDPGERDFSGPVAKLLLVDESRARATALDAVLHTRLEFESRRRTDVEFVFIGAQPLQGRLVRPALQFHRAGDLPVYSTSDIFEPAAQANSDLEGVMFPDMPWVISPDSVSTQLRDALTRYWPVRARGRGRLYAFGFDAYRLIPLLKAGQFGSEHAIPGMTGLLSIDDSGRVHRQLDWARVTDGRAEPIGTTTMSATQP
ncbi:MAG TPA: penicillin-binding protein activator [Steroidobacteraceae bacterium]|nr:penicillin-binding protein activator [Steroidobacteraceae bacterium]